MGYSYIFIIGILWFFIEKELFSHYNKNFIEKNNHKKYVYSSISHPRIDDLIFNYLGILLHFCFITNYTCFNLTK